MEILIYSVSFIRILEKTSLTTGFRREGYRQMVLIRYRQSLLINLRELHIFLTSGEIIMKEVLLLIMTVYITVMVR